ncbi:U4/U6.U5 tri-snRNP-associated protein 1 isoform X2 [Rhynchophorus ferrugineus]|uniref:U4/U6.U5 tri-snRNP-associated protein 1 isoform X2 n=1 Tax=Rhynchophorus ferrugineus TaxID=354439 RepID=UPI003FCCB4BB
MGSSSKSKYKEKDQSRSSKRRHESPNGEDYDTHREKKHKHKHRHHKERRREKSIKIDFESDVEVVPIDNSQTEEGEPSGQGAESLSIDETNKLRAKLGLKPLEVNTSDVGKKGDGKKKDDLGEFYHKPAENLFEKAEREKIRAKLSEHKEKRLLHNKLSKVRGLGEESDSEDDDVSNWVDKNRKLATAKKEAEKRAKMLEELDAQFGIGEVIEQEQREKRKQQYSARDLKGLMVEHDVDSLAEEKVVILTLKDQAVLDTEDDVLVNVNMIDNEKYKKNVDNKKRKIHYNPYEDQEFDEFGNPKEKSLLSKYDEEISGAKKDGFRIGYDNAVERKQAAVQSVKEKLARKQVVFLPEKNLTLASEYYNEEELAKFKKPKKKTRKIRTKGKLTADELSQSHNADKYKAELSIDDVPNVEIPTNINLEDDKDDLLERALHKTRKIKQKENLVADIIKSEVKEEPEDDGNVDSGNIVLNATAEFCRTLGDIPTYGKSGNRDEDEDMLDFEKETVDDEKSDDECKIIETSGWNTVDPRSEGADVNRVAPQEVQILDEEPDVSTGVGAALKLAMSKGYLDKEQNSRPSNSRLAHLQAQHYSIEDKSYGDESERGGRSSGRDRYSGPIQEFREKDGFKPNVKLEYIDDEGHILNSKEAFRYLSHKFHGKGPGKNKVEKRIKKGAQEQLMKKMSSTDTPLGTLNMLQAKQKETQSAFIVLSGNKQQQATAISKTRR